jgi:hypothetical protein
MDLYLPSDIQEIAGGIILNAAIDTTGNNKLVAQIIQALWSLGKTCYFGEFRDCDCGD